eukprot:Rhum_TRINITY_DN14711_c2_g1::Rhum_TRINITY_DN14711_c2_g1_i1::g.111597::m.111597
MCAVPTGTVDATAPSPQHASSRCASDGKVLKHGAGDAQPPLPSAHHAVVFLPCDGGSGSSGTGSGADGGATGAPTTAAAAMAQQKPQQQGGEASYCLFLGAAAEGDSDLCELFGGVGHASQRDALLPRRHAAGAGSPGRGEAEEEETGEAASGVGRGPLSTLSGHTSVRGLYVSSGVAVRLLVAGAALGCLYFA